MKITRYFQSCLLIELDKARILIDPSGLEADNIDKFGKIDAVFYTHEHSDHFDANLAKTFDDQRKVSLYANDSTAKNIDAAKTIVKDRQEYDINGVKVKAIELPHSLMPDGSIGPQNTGYLINKKFFHPGDGYALEGLQVTSMALPVIGPDISVKDAFAFAKQLGAKNIIPIHYDKFELNPKVVASFAQKYNFPFLFKILNNGESIEF